MKDLKKLSDSDLLSTTKKLTDQERELVTQILWHLKEVSDRRLFAARGFSSLFEYAVQELRYSEPAAARRINAMQLLVEIPEVAAAIESGSMNLTTVSTVQGFFKREQKILGKSYSLEAKKEILELTAHQSKRECQSLLALISPESALPSENVRPLTEKHTELRVIVNEVTLANLEKLRGLLAHQNPDGSYGGLLNVICEIALEKVDPVRIELRIQKAQERRKQKNLATKNQGHPEINDRQAEDENLAKTGGVRESSPTEECSTRLGEFETGLSLQRDAKLSRVESEAIVSTPPADFDAGLTLQRDAQLGQIESEALFSTTPAEPKTAPTLRRGAQQNHARVQDPSVRFTPLTEHVQNTPPEGQLINSARITNPDENPTPSTLAKNPSEENFQNPHYVPHQLRRQVTLRDKGRCVYKDPVTGRICGSTYKLQVDHCTPVALGGKSTLDNLRLFCARHNQWEATTKLGEDIMRKYVPSLK